jgi:hypothetical protein
MPIILFVVPVGMISKNITSLTSQNVVYSALLAEVAVLKFSVLLIPLLSAKNFHSLMKVDRRGTLSSVRKSYHYMLFRLH